MPLIPDRETSDWSDLADALCQMEQSFAYKQLLLWLTAQQERDCPDFNNLKPTAFKSMSTDTQTFLLGGSYAYARGTKAIPELRAYCEAQATRDRKKEKKNAAREDSRERTGREEYR